MIPGAPDGVEVAFSRRVRDVAPRAVFPGPWTSSARRQPPVNPRPMLRAILFDAAGTLIYLPRSVGEHYAEVAAGFGAHLAPSALDAAFRQVWKEMPDRPPTADGTPRPDDDKGWWRTLVARVLDRTWPARERPTGFDEAACFEQLYAHFAGPGVWEVFPEVRETLTALRRRGGLRLAVVSNFDRRLLAVLGHLGLRGFFEGVFLSSEVGADKPDPRLFHRALEALGVGADEALHVGDDPAKDWGAERLGLRVFRLERPGNSLRELLAEIERGE